MRARGGIQSVRAIGSVGDGLGGMSVETSEKREVRSRCGTAYAFPGSILENGREGVSRAIRML